jgi:hypothetical protein
MKNDQPYKAFKLLTIRKFILICAIVSAFFGNPFAIGAEPIIGAIRWDGWQDTTDINTQTTAVLCPNRWHYRLPFFSQVTGSNSVVIHGNTQAIMDQEINYAANAGIDYWAFDIYSETSAPTSDFSGMSHGLHLYLNSTNKSRIKFVLDLQGGHLAQTSGPWSNQITRYVNYFKDPSYQKVLGNRPLVYLFCRMDPFPMFTNAAAAAIAIKQLRVATTNAGLGNPYIVFQGWVASDDFKTLQEYGLDALGAYASGGGISYASLAAQAHRFWEAGKATGANVVPIVGSGWDNRPFYETPVAIYPNASTNYTLPPTPVELANHLAEALDWTISNHVSITPANTVLIYAWNEHSEGGWICPTLNPDGSTNSQRLAAIAKMLKSRTANHASPTSPR